MLSKRYESKEVDNITLIISRDILDTFSIIQRDAYLLTNFLFI